MNSASPSVEPVADIARTTVSLCVPTMSTLAAGANTRSVCSQKERSSTAVFSETADRPSFGKKSSRLNTRVCTPWFDRKRCCMLWNISCPPKSKTVSATRSSGSSSSAPAASAGTLLTFTSPTASDKPIR
eukprot:scaffold664_cov260-Pinguiococcus_pyrenoidosus.AAC.24